MKMPAFQMNSVRDMPSFIQPVSASIDDPPQRDADRTINQTVRKLSISLNDSLPASQIKLMTIEREDNILAHERSRIAPFSNRAAFISSAAYFRVSGAKRACHLSRSTTRSFQISDMPEFKLSIGWTLLAALDRGRR